MPQNIKIQGKPLSEITYPLYSEYNHIEKSFSLESDRGKAEIIDIGSQDEDIIGLEFDDGGRVIADSLACCDPLHQQISKN